MLSKITRQQIIWAIFTVALLAGVLILNQRASGPFEKVRMIEYTFKTERLHPDMASLVKKGQKVINSPGGQVIGRVHNYKIEPHVEPVTTRTGEIKKASDPYYKNVFIKVRAKGYANEDLVALHNEVVQAGPPAKLNTAVYVFDGRITDIKILDE